MTQEKEMKYLEIISDLAYLADGWLDELIDIDGAYPPEKSLALIKEAKLLTSDIVGPVEKPV